MNRGTDLHLHGATAEDAGNGSTLLPMLIGGLVLIVLGAAAVMMFV